VDIFDEEIWKFLESSAKDQIDVIELEKIRKLKEET
jgi:hypothetical protein